MRRPAVVLGVGVVVAGLATAAATAAWKTTASGTATAKALAMPTGSTPIEPVATAPTSVGSIVVKWPETSYPGVAEPVDGYTIRRYKGNALDATGPAAACSGTITALTCTDVVTVTGAYSYTVTPVSGTNGQWKGAASSKSGVYRFKGVTPPRAPDSVSLVNGGGDNSAFINAANKSALRIRSALPAGAQVGDQVVLTITDAEKAHTVTAPSVLVTAAGRRDVDQIVDVSSLDDGVVTISAKVINAAGTSSAVAIRPTKDVVAPSAPTITSPANDASSQARSTVFSGTAGEAGGSVVVTVTWSGGSRTSSAATPKSTLSWVTSLLSPTLANNGTFRATAKHADAAGNTSVASTAITYST